MINTHQYKKESKVLKTQRAIKKPSPVKVTNEECTFKLDYFKVRSEVLVA